MEIETTQQRKLELQGHQKMVAITIQRLEEAAPVPTTDNNKGKALHEKKQTMEVEWLLLTEKDANGFKFRSSKDIKFHHPILPKSQTLSFKFQFHGSKLKFGHARNHNVRQ